MIAIRPFALAMVAALFLCTPAVAQTTGGSGADAERPFCATRPSLGAGTCIVDGGHPMLEMGVADWQREQADGARSDLFVTGDALFRVALGRTTEAQLGWTALGRQRVRDADGSIDRRTRIGDVSVGLRQSLVHADGQGFSLAVQPFVTVPVGREPIGAGSWGGGLTVPVGYDLNDVVQLQLTAEVDATPDADGHGRHRTLSAIGGVGLTLGDSVSATVELSAARDRDPDGDATILLGAVSAGYQLTDAMQVDAGTAIGLNADSPDVRVFAGFSRRF